jgi:hypothetical protein
VQPFIERELQPSSTRENAFENDVSILHHAASHLASI